LFVFSFDVKVAQDAAKLADEMGVKVNHTLTLRASFAVRRH